MGLHSDISHVILSEAQIQQRVAELGADISKEYGDEPVLLVAHRSPAALRPTAGSPPAPDTVPKKDLRDTPNNNGRFHFVKRPSPASNCKLCPGVLPKPIPTSSIM